jgi:hypothetical protein
VASLPGRQNEHASSAMPTVLVGSPVSFHPAMHTSQLPAVGVPEPPPTEFATSSSMTVDCNAGGVVVPYADGCANVTDH